MPRPFRSQVFRGIVLGVLLAAAVVAAWWFWPATEPTKPQIAGPQGNFP